MTFDPTTLTGKRLWLRAKDNGASGSVITTWTDQSGKGNSPTVAGGTNPTVATGATPAGGKVARLGGTSNFVLPVDAAMRGKVTSSGPWSANTVDYTADNVIDGATTIANGNTWVYDSTPAFWQIEPYTPEVITSYRIMPGSQYPTAWTFAGSNDGSSWTTLDTRSGQVGSSGTFSSSYTFSNATAYRYYRFNFTAANGGGIVHIAEIEFNGRANQTGSARKGEIWAVLKNANTNVMGLWAFGSDTAGSYYPATGTVLSEQFGVSSRPTSVAPGVALTSWRLYRVVQDGTNLKIYLDGTLLQTAAITPSWRSITPLIGSSADGVRYTGDIAEILYLDDPSDATQTANLIDYFNTEHGLTVTGGAAPVATTTVAAPVTVGAAFSAQTVLTTTLAMAASVGLAFSATSIPRTTVDMPVTVGASFAATTVEAGTTTLAAPATAGMAFDARSVLSTTLSLPVSAGLAFDASTVLSTTLSLPVAVGLSFEADQQDPTTMGMPVTFGLEFSASTGGATTFAMPVTGGLSFYGSTDQVVAAPWTTDLSQRTLLVIQSAVTSPTFVAPLDTMPATIAERPIGRSSVIVPNLTTVTGARVDPTTGQIAVPDDIYDAFPVTTSTLGVPHIIIDGVDVTYFRDSRTLVGEDRAAEPFGDQTLTVDFPQVSTMDDPDDIPWLRNDAPVHYVMQHWDADGPTGVVSTLFHGRLVSDDSGNDDTRPQKTWQARGTLYAAASFVHQPRVMVNPVDIGVQVPKALNGVTSRRYGKIANVTTGIQTVQRGNPGEKVMEYAQGLLADAWTSGGNQWTVAKKVGTAASYEMRLKKTGVDWTVTNGQRGVAVSLSTDSTQSRNVIWGRGQRSDGGVWMRKLYPDAGRTAPAYPYSSAGTVMSVGDTDGGTLDGDGVSKWQRRAKALGFRVTVDGVFSSADASVARALQRQFGILVDGIVGPQTWAETFDVGAAGADPDLWVRLPLAWLPGTQPFRYRANGSVIGADPAYDRTITIVSDDLDMGTDVTLADGIRSAQQILDRENPAPLTGQLVLTVDPRQGSRFSIEPGDRIKVIGYEGRDVVLHIAERAREWTSKGAVTLQVAERATDALTLAQIRQRNNANRADPARRPGKARTKPVIDPWDCESNAGHIERHALYGGLWTVIRIPMSEVGRISEISMRTTGASRFSVFLFANPITSAQMIHYVGANPLALDSPGESNRELLEDRFGWLEGWGRSGDALGYYPGSEGSGAHLTGRFKDAGVDYWSPTGYIYIAEYAASSCFIEGDMRAAPPEA